MKKLYVLISFAALLSGAVSCSLKEEADAFATPDTFFQTEAQCKAALNGCYIPAKILWNSSLNQVTDCCSDLLYCTTNKLDLGLDISPSNPRFGSSAWRQGYAGVRNCNDCIYGFEHSPVPAEKLAPMIAEAKILRAFFYYFLTCMFKDVPFYLESIRSHGQLAKIARYGRMDAHIIRDSLITELQEIVGDPDAESNILPQRRTYEDPDRRAGAMMGNMLIAKMAMWEEEWDVALEALRRIEKVYGEFTEENYPLSDIRFSERNVPERIFEIQHRYVMGGISYVGGFSSICLPKREQGTSIYAGVDIPELGNMAVTYTAMRPNLHFLSNFYGKNSTDKRKDYVFAWSYKGQTFTGTSTRPWPGPKFWCWNMQNAEDGNNYPVYRYADAILMMAECFCMNYDLDQATLYLNKVKTRAGITTFPSGMGQTEIMEEIKKERGRELIGEFMRKFDLVRWGEWYDTVVATTDNATIKQNIRPCHEYYPIPDTEIKNSHGALDNDAYDRSIDF